MRIDFLGLQGFLSIVTDGLLTRRRGMPFSSSAATVRDLLILSAAAA